MSQLSRRYPRDFDHVIFAEGRFAATDGHSFAVSDDGDMREVGGVWTRVTTEIADSGSRIYLSNPTDGLIIVEP